MFEAGACSDGGRGPVGRVNADQGLADAGALPQELHAEQHRPGGQTACARPVQAEGQDRLVLTAIGLVESDVDGPSEDVTGEGANPESDVGPASRPHRADALDVC